MPQNTPDPETLRAAVLDVTRAIGRLPAAGLPGRSAYDIERARREAAIAELRRTLETREPWPATIREDGAQASVRILGIRASSTAGLIGALRNWMVAARRRADELERANTGTPTVAGGEGAHG